MDKRLSELFNEIYTPICDLDVTAYITHEPVPYGERTTGERRVLTPGERWGELWDCAWMNMKCTVPRLNKGKKPALLIDVGGEACVFDGKGVPFIGLTNKESFYSFELGMPGKFVIDQPDIQADGDCIDIWLDCGANDLFGECCDSPRDKIGVLHRACLAETDEAKRTLYYDLEVILYYAGAIGNEKLRARALAVADKAFAVYRQSMTAALRATHNFLTQGSDYDFRITALGHAHIDLAWLWPIRETKRKAARTFATVLRNMEKYPEYRFGVSQPQMLEWVREEHPELFESFRRLIAEHRIEPQGGFWVESDTNIPCGESLVRQMLYGKRYFRENFGYEQEILWIPDVFGYSAQLPQIMRKSGVKYFLTIKMSWNSVNKFPHSTFRWKGLDGSEILTHMPPEGNYNSAARPESLLATAQKFRESNIDNRAMLLFGIGDGGGGPGREHLERLRREKCLVGLPQTKQAFAIDFFRDIDRDRKKFPQYAGELYLEKHQGTYTSQSRNKRFNRKCEFALREAEFMSAAALVCAGREPQAAQLEKLWKEVLLYQFHDIIPGSSIKRVYDETDARYHVILSEIGRISAEAAESFTAGGSSVYNPAPFDFGGYIYHGGEYRFVKAPANGFGGFAEDALPACTAGGDYIENELIRVTFTPEGGIASVRSKESGYEYLSAEANVLTLYEDNENAWEVPPDYAQNPHERLIPVSTDTVINGKSAERRYTYRHGDTTIAQTVRLLPGSRRIDFVTEVCWQETHRMLRTAFPVCAHNDNAMCDIQYGSIPRPTHRRDSFSAAKKEVCAHKWVDISDGTHGGAVLSDCKYGYRVWDCVIDLNLLRSSMYPGVNADKGTQVFTYSFLPHEGDHTGDVIREGYFLNLPPKVTGGATEKLAGRSFVASSEENVVLDWIKPSEDGKSIVVRAYESAGKTTRAVMSTAFLFKRVVLCDLLENELATCDREIPFYPFEIQTIKFVL